MQRYSTNFLYRRTLKAIAGSVVVPDFEIILIETSLPSQISTSSERALLLIELPVKKICGVSLHSRL